MFKLRFAEPHERAPLPPAGDPPDTHIWLNRWGGVVARGFRHAGSYWMAWPHLATFGFRPGDLFISAHPERGADSAIIWDTYRRVVLPMAMQVNGWEALHASAVVSRQRVVAFCAVSETGKSTVAFGLRRRGFAQWSDDGIVFASSGQEIFSVPLPFQVRLRPGSRAIFGEAFRQEPFPPDDPGGPGEQAHTDPLPLAAICVLARAAGGMGNRPRLSQVAPAAAFPAMLTHAHEFDPSDEERRSRMIQTYLDLVERVPVYEVTFTPDRERLDLLLDTISEGLNLELPTTTPIASYAP